ncbi:MAG: Usg family protein [Rhodospirillales bacterium]|nr:Usg family protein [Rhodospirillales bacterium]
MHLPSRPREWRLTTAEILYRLPDHPGLLQTFIWQDYDLAPQFPELRRFLAFWRRELDGPLHSVRVAAADSLARGRWRHAGHLLTLQ